MEEGQDIGENECDVTGQVFEEDRERSGECIIGPNNDGGTVPLAMAVTEPMCSLI